MAAARGGLTAAQLAAVTGLGVDELPSVLDAVGCFAAAPSGVWRIVHQSIADWLISQDAKEFRIDVAAGRDRLLAFCRKWKSNRDPYALTHVVTHLLDAGHVDDAAGVIRDGLFELRNDVVGEPRLDGEDTRALTAVSTATTMAARRMSISRSMKNGPKPRPRETVTTPTPTKVSAMKSDRPRHVFATRSAFVGP